MVTNLHIHISKMATVEDVNILQSNFDTILETIEENYEEEDIQDDSQDTVSFLILLFLWKVAFPVK